MRTRDYSFAMGCLSSLLLLAASAMFAVMALVEAGVIR